jgi:hypothetical protein
MRESSSNLKCPDRLQRQVYCHQCMSIQGCDEWQGNDSGFQGLGDDIGEVMSQGGWQQESPSIIVPVVGIGIRLLSHEANISSDGTHIASQLRGPFRMLVQDIMNSTGGDRDGMASGGVEVHARDSVIDGYAAGSDLNITVEMLDAYGQVVNTDVLRSAKPGASAPSVQVSINATNVFLSGVQSKEFAAGVAVLDRLKLVAEPGVYNLRLDSAGLESSYVEVQHFTICIMPFVVPGRKTLSLLGIKGSSCGASHSCSPSRSQFDLVSWARSS